MGMGLPFVAIAAAMGGVPVATAAAIGVGCAVAGGLVTAFFMRHVKQS